MFAFLNAFNHFNKNSIFFHGSREMFLKIVLPNTSFSANSFYSYFGRSLAHGELIYQGVLRSCMQLGLV